ncbi:CST complex subunit TEN1 isoform X4 [Pristis pectinata]|nr:CST complex subunit TEN1 isoform X4 [Pristis pectinata]XP_051895907.1 CST complex subunit TEN1 isoform X4 [Pristis pectinata]
MLPQPGVFHFLWEICSGAADEGSAVRTFGRLTNYDARISEAALCVHHNSIDYSLRVLTSLVEPFEARVGAEYMVLGEMETTTGNGNHSTGFGRVEQVMAEDGIKQTPQRSGYLAGAKKVPPLTEAQEAHLLHSQAAK